MSDIEKVRKVVQDELAKARESLQGSAEGEARNPDDPEWTTLAECYREAVAGLERIQAAVGAPETENAL